jgi:hypothetical protein
LIADRAGSRNRSKKLWKITSNLGGKLVVREAGYSSLPHLRGLLEIAAIPEGATKVKHGQRVVGMSIGVQN